jgi:hypothetical protein
MNINKTNKLGIILLENRFDALKDFVNNVKKNPQLIAKPDAPPKNVMAISLELYKYKNNTKVFRVSKNIIENCKLINIDSIKDNIDVNEFNFTSLVIMLDNDASGIIKIERLGADFDFIYIQNLSTNLKGKDVTLNRYSFLTKDFLYSGDHDFAENPEKHNFVVQLLAYLYYGEITKKELPPKTEIKLSTFSKIVNHTKIHLTFVDSLWKQRISTDGFKVRGHFRLQPIGEARLNKKLIWIEEFKKEGYNRKATREIS